MDAGEAMLESEELAVTTNLLSSGDGSSQMDALSDEEACDGTNHVARGK